MEGPISDSGITRLNAPAQGGGNVQAKGGSSSDIFLPLDSDGGIALSSLKPGTVLEVATRNHVYTLIPQESGATLIWGHPDYCPEPVLRDGVGSSYLNGIFREGYIGNGMRLNFPVDGKRVYTSRIERIQARRRS